MYDVMKKIPPNWPRIVAICLCVASLPGIVFGSSPKSSEIVASPCDPQDVGQMLAKHFGMQWNEGKTRAWSQSGDFWSLPFKHSLPELTAAINKLHGGRCIVHIADQGGFTARIIPKEKFENSFKKAYKEQNNAGSQNDLIVPISPWGSTLGVLEPTKGEKLLILYPARIAAAIAHGGGQIINQDFPEIAKKFKGTQDLEYVFGNIKINVLGGSAKISMSEASRLVFSEIQSKGFHPANDSLAAVRRFDGWLVPSEHQSLWNGPDGVILVDLKQMKGGIVHFSLNENRMLKAHE